MKQLLRARSHVPAWKDHSPAGMLGVLSRMLEHGVPSFGHGYRNSKRVHHQPRKH